MSKKEEDILLNECYQEVFKVMIALQTKYSNQMIGRHNDGTGLEII